MKSIIALIILAAVFSPASYGSSKEALQAETIRQLTSLPTSEGMPGRTPLSDGKQFHDSIASTGEIRIYEGLPHQIFERELMKKEMKRIDVIEIAKFPFYTPFIIPKEEKNLKEILSEPASLNLFTGEKWCGGFHPDYCISWDNDAKVFNALICFGCHEIIFETEGRRFRYDLEQKAYDELKKILSAYATKRPKKENG